MNNKYQKIDKFLYCFSILFLTIPISIQLFAWFNPIAAIPCVIMLTIATVLVIKKFKPLSVSDYKNIFNKRKMLILAVLILIINILSGAGGLFPQNWDYHGRNAIFHDLVSHSWPVEYDYSAAELEHENNVYGNSGLLNYYFTWWIPSAIVGKITNFDVGNFFLLIWQTIGVTIFFYLVCRYMRNIKYRYFWIFIAFSGLSIISYTIASLIQYHGVPVPPFGTTHIDWSTGPFDLSTFVVQIFWVFNQSIPAWIATMLFLQQKNYKTCGFFLAILLPYAPFPTLGLFYLIVCYILFGKDLKSRLTLDRFKSLFTIDNIFACLSILPIAYTFTLNGSQKGNLFIDLLHNNASLLQTISLYLLYIIFEFLIYIIIINKQNRRHLLMLFIFFAIIPTFYIGGGERPRYALNHSSTCRFISPYLSISR